MKKIIILHIIITAFISCSKETALPEREYPNAETVFSNPEVGGANEPNQVFVDLSTEKSTKVQRDSWDLGFYCNDDIFRVSLNGSIYMATIALDFNDIDAVRPADVTSLYPEIGIGTFDPINVNYVDDFDGDINQTAIAEISEIPTENKVYLLNMGYSVGTDQPDAGSVAVAGEHRGWKKIRILRNGDDYLLQYANIDDTTHQELTISKDEAYHYTHFSFKTENTLLIEPEKTNWDLCFTVFTNEITGFGTYGFTDFIVNNIKGDVKTYQVEEIDLNEDGVIDNPFTDFTQADIVSENFENSHRAIGSNWRLGGGPGVSPVVKDDIYYILKDPEGLLYKLKFLALMNDSGVRGYPQFEYQLLQ